MGRYEEAIRSYDDVLSKSSDFAFAYYGKAYSLDQLERYEEAIVCYENVIRIRPDYILAYYCKGKDLEKVGKENEANKCLQQAKKLEAGNFNNVIPWTIVSTLSAAI